MVKTVVPLYMLKFWFVFFVIMIKINKEYILNFLCFQGFLGIYTFLKKENMLRIWKKKLYVIFENVWLWDMYLLEC